MWTRNRLLKSLLALGLLPLSSFALSKGEAQKEDLLPDKVDVIVIGSGAAGMSAAISAKDKGAKTVILEKMPIIGGNTLISSGVVNAPDEKNQKLQGIEDSNEWFYKQTLAAGHDKADPALVKVLTDRSYQTIQWLESIGVKFKKGVFQVYGGCGLEVIILRCLTGEGTSQLCQSSAEQKIFRFSRMLRWSL